MPKGRICEGDTFNRLTGGEYSSPLLSIKQNLMDKLTELCEFLAWVQDNYVEVADDEFVTSGDFQHEKVFTREEVVIQYLKERGIKV